MVELDPYFSIIAGFVSAVVAAIVIRLLIDRYKQPVLEIDGAIIIREFLLHSHTKGHVKYFANRVSVKNRGRSAAKDCKAYIDYEDNTQRTAWLLPDRNSGYTIILNINDREFVDLCAISGIDHVRIFPPERGYENEFDTEYASRLWPSAGEFDITLRISSSNAKSTERRVRLHNRFKPFPNDPGRIIEFIE